MYKCICGSKTNSKWAMEQHMQTCPAVRKVSNDSTICPNDSTIFAICCVECTGDETMGSISSSSSDSFSGSGGSFDGGGSSDDY